MGVAQATHRLDDVADAVGLDPKPEPDPEDDRLVRDAALQVSTLLALVEATASRHDGLALAPFEVILREQLAAVGGSLATTDAEPPPDDPKAALEALTEAFGDVAKTLRRDCLRAFSPALTRVLAAMSAGVAQCAQEIGDLR